MMIFFLEFENREANQWVKISKKTMVAGVLMSDRCFVIARPDLDTRMLRRTKMYDSVPFH